MADIERRLADKLLDIASALEEHADALAELVASDLNDAEVRLSAYRHLRSVGDLAELRHRDPVAEPLPF